MARRPKPWYRSSRQAWFVTLGGVQHNLGPDKDQAYERFYQLMRRPQQLPRKVSPESLLAICDSFLDWTHKHRAVATYEWYRSRLQEFIAAGNKDLRVSDLRPFHVQQWADHYPDHAQTTRRNNIRAVKRCLRWALKQGYIENNPIAHMEMPSAESCETVVTPVMFEELLQHVTDSAFRDLLLVTWETGCRPQELLRVEKHHVDLTQSRWVLSRFEAKGKRMPRVIYLTGNALEITQRLMLSAPTGPLFRNSHGRAWNKSSVGCAFSRVQFKMGQQILAAQRKDANEKQLAEEDKQIRSIMKTLKPTCTAKGDVRAKTGAELRTEAKRKYTQRRCRDLAPRYSLYALRHSWATNALQNGVDALTVAILMGHKDPSTLARVYQHLSHNPDHLLEQAKKAAG